MIQSITNAIKKRCPFHVEKYCKVSDCMAWKCDEAYECPKCGHSYTWFDFECLKCGDVLISEECRKPAGYCKLINNS